jgi:putative PIG3 family NAD(P)H quinone oxidoreductase
MLWGSGTVRRSLSFRAAMSSTSVSDAFCIASARGDAAERNRPDSVAQATPMRRVDVVERDGRYVSHLIRCPDPRPASGEVLVRVAASGVNRADLSQIAGSYPPPAGESEILGLEAAGTVESTGEEVCALLAGGGHAELVAVPRGQLLRRPRNMDAVHAAAVPEAFVTAFVNLVVEANLRAGETLLAHAGASGVGLAAIQVGRLLGARVAATTRSASKLDAMREAGAELAIDTSRQSFVQEIESHWGRDQVSVVLDPVGAGTVADDLRALATGGRVVILATLSGAQAQLDLRLLMAKRARLIGSVLRARSRAEKAALVERFTVEILPALDDGRLRVPIDVVYPPEQAAEAFTQMRENRNTGKIVIDWTRTE